MSEFEKVINNIDINLVYEKLSKIEVPLERQQNYNRHYIDQKIVESDKALDLLDKINTQVIQELTNFEIRQSIVEEEIANKKRNELTNNQELLKKYNTGREREAAVELLITGSMAELSKLNRRILALKNLAGIIKTKQSIIIKKMRNIQDQSRMMSDLLKSNVPLPEDKDTALLMKNLSEVEKLEESLDADDVGETSEYVELDQNSDVHPSNNSEQSGSQDVDLSGIDVSGVRQEPQAADVTLQDASTPELSTNIDTSEITVDVITQEDSTVADKKPDNISSKTDSDTSPEEEEESELDMDTVLDGLDPEDNDTEVMADSKSSSKDSAGVVLEDIFSENDAVVTDEPAKKSGQGEPTLKEKIPVKSQPKDVSKKVHKEDNATVPGDVCIDNILDDLSSF